MFKNPPRLLILQLECPLRTVLLVIERASTQSNPIPVLLNPAPAVELPDWIYKAVEILVLNETEAAMLSGLPLDFTSETVMRDSALNVAKLFRTKGCAVVIVTLGAHGAVFTSVSEEGWLPAEKVAVVDTTGAGDTFIGAFAVEWVLGVGKDSRLADCVAFANRAAAWSVGRRGTWGAVPKREDLAQI